MNCVLLTVTLHVLYTAGLAADVTVISAVPFFSAVTNPVSDTVATFSSLELHVTDLSSALSGFGVAVSWNVLPPSRDRLVLFRLIEVTGCTTVTLQVAFTLPTVTLIEAVPTPFAVILPPSSTVTMLSLFDFHDTASV